MAKQIGVDVGGTFTDVIVSDDMSGGVIVGKGLTVAAQPDVGVLDVLDEILGPTDWATADYFLHGTTVGLNALLQREGATVGLIATSGFRDTLEIRRGNRGNPYDLFWAPPSPLVPRRLRRPISARMLADGSVLVPLDVSEVDHVWRAFQSEGVASIAVVLINSYANPEHENGVAERLRELGFDGPLSLSHQLSGEYREYERTSTTVIDAYVRPRVAEYLGRLEKGLRSRGFSGEALVTRCGGGAMTFSQAADRPFETLISGPVAGVVGAAVVAQRHGFAKAVSADVGGTSFDTCLVVEGRPGVKYEGVIEGLPVQTEWVDVRSIGAGGGSIASTDAGGLLRVGPRSAGAAPGPACYGRGGLEATTTDAAVVLGMMGPGELAGGLRLDVEMARTAVSKVAAEAGVSTEEAARGIIVINSAGMAGAIREITVERGEDPRDAALIAFGGAGPIYATLLASELDMETVLVPVHAGNFSACGLLASDVVQSVARTQILPFDATGLEAAVRTAELLWAELDARSGTVVHGSGKAYRVALDMRYAGQDHTLTIPVRVDDREVRAEVGQVAEAFASAYRQMFGLTMDETAVQIVTVRATVAIPRGGTLPSLGTGPRMQSAEVGSALAWSFSSQEWLPFQVVQRDRLAPGETLIGPAIVLEPTATTYLDQGFVASVADDAVLVISRKVEVKGAESESDGG